MHCHGKKVNKIVKNVVFLLARRIISTTMDSIKIASKRLSQYLKQRSSITLLLWGILLTLGVGLLDYVTGYRMGFSLFYLFPIMVVTWAGNLILGIITSFIAALVWLAADALTCPSYINLFIPTWNFTLRLSIFLIFSYLFWHAKAAQEKQKTLIEFIVHDLRSPLNTITMGLSNLKEIDSQNLTEQQREVIEAISTASQRQATLINSTLDLAALEKNKRKIKLETFSTRQLINDVIAENSVWTTRNKVNIQTELNLTTDQTHTDKTLLFRILINLLSNAIKASPENSIVTVTAKKQGPNLYFSVKDQGGGISANIKKKLFSPFTRGGYSHETLTVGSGIGLTFCKAAVKELDGKIWVESQAGKGTTVTFTLPQNLVE